MKFQHIRICLVGCLMGTFAIGCGGNQESTSGGGKDEIEIECHFFYRASTQTATGENKVVSITVPFLEGDVPEIALDISEKAEFEDLSCGLSASYNALSVTFSAAGRTTSSMLFQFAEVPENGMAGGHGFSGLHYVYHPESEAELQFWARVKDPGESNAGE